jgi:hypothetical protein
MASERIVSKGPLTANVLLGIGCVLDSRALVADKSFTDLLAKLDLIEDGAGLAKAVPKT